MSQKSWWTGPVKAEPDFNNMLKILRREKPDRPTLFELFMNPTVYNIGAGATKKDFKSESLYRAAAFRNLGYDYATINLPGFEFPRGELKHKNGASISQNEGAMIFDRKTFDAYPWPDPAKAGYSTLEEVGRTMPPGFKAIVLGPCGVLENATFLMGFENMCYIIADDEKLAGDIFNEVGSRLVKFYEECVKYDSVGAIIGNDDWGFKTQPMLSPAEMRKFVVPWHKRIVEVAHKAGKPAIMHSCGNLASLMDDIIDDIGYDAKHSYEDSILPVEQAYDTYGKRIAIMGGIDVDFICRSSPEAVHERAKALIRKTGNCGYALGSGNSIPEYVPAESYFALISAATAER